MTQDKWPLERWTFNEEADEDNSKCTGVRY